ncbi:MAG: DUF2142 domain-containing protein [Thermomicrobia bacterium]|nr:DUF2142 domain-containing protein [Thermomicrobia bacterium]
MCRWHHYDFETARTYTASDTGRYDAGTARATPYPPLYYLLMAVPDALFHDQPIVSRIFAMRAATALIGALSCLFAYLFAYEVRRTRLWGGSFGLCIAFMPTYAHLTASINNDAAVDACAIVLMWLIVRAYRRQALSAPLALALGMLSGLSLLSKPDALPVLIVAGVIVLVRAFPFQRASPYYHAERLRVIGLYIAGGALTYGPWMLFRLAYYGDIGAGTGSLSPLFHTIIHLPLLTTHVAASSLAAQTISPAPFALFTHSLGAYFHYLRAAGGIYFEALFIKGFWGIFGWGGSMLPREMITAIKVFFAIGAVGLIAHLVVRREQRRIALLLIGVVLLQVLFIFLGVDYYLSFARTGQPLGIQGRYFMPMLVPLLYLLLSGWYEVCGNHPLALRIAPVAMLVLDFAGFASILSVHYGITGW